MQKYYIYRITNLIDNKTYVGQRHCPKNKTPEEDDYMGSGKIIKLAERKYGIKNFKKEILYRDIQFKATVDDMEIYAIAKERERVGVENCYNIADGGGGCSGLHHSAEARAKMSYAKQHISDETRARMSEAQKHRAPMSAATRAKMSAAMKNKPPRSLEYRKHISEAQKHKPPMSDETSAKIRAAKQHISDETRAKMSASAKNRPHLSMSDETRAKMSASQKGRVVTLEQRIKISNTLKGRHPSAETIAKSAAGHRGLHRSAETKAKMSAAQKGNNLGLLWWNNGEKEIKAKECPEGYKRGRITSHKGEHNPMYGKKQTEETKLKQRTASLGKTHKGATYTEQMIQDMSNLKKQQAIVKRVREKNGTTSE